MSDVSPIQRAREMLAACDSLENSSAFQWFMEDAISARMEAEMEKMTDLRTPLEGVNLSRHVYAALKEVSDHLATSRAAAKASLDSQPKT